MGNKFETGEGGGVMSHIGASEPPSRVSYNFDVEVKGGSQTREPVRGPLNGTVIGPFGRSLRSDNPYMTYRVANGWLVREDGHRVRRLP